MTPPAEDRQWIVVTSESELQPFLDPAKLAPLASDDDLGERCEQFCQTGALNEVRRGRPVALLLTDTQQLVRLRIPAVGRVVTCEEDGENIRFTITGSPMPFTMPAQPGNIAPIAAALKERQRLLVIDPLFDGRAVEVQPFTAPSFRCTGQFPLDRNRVSAIDDDTARSHYQGILDQESVDPFDRGLPFRFSRGYCWVIAHAVATFLGGKGLTVGKAWAFAKRGRVMTIPTTSRATCQQDWWYHVAVVVRSTTDGSLRVFDPISRLERGVATLDEWKANFGPQLGRVHLKRADAFFLQCDDQADCNPDDPCFDTGGDPDELDEALRIARCAQRCVSKVEGAPPFACPNR